VNGPDLELVREILGCLEAIDRAEATAWRFPQDPDIAEAALRTIKGCNEAIRAAVGSLSLELREDHPAVPWSAMARKPDLIGAHDDMPDPRELASELRKALKGLRSACQAILAESVRIGEDEP
jgi:uncharacterized protein with HEPN domain